MERAELSRNSDLHASSVPAIISHQANPVVTEPYCQCRESQQSKGEIQQIVRMNVKGKSRSMRGPQRASSVLVYGLLLASIAAAAHADSAGTWQSLKSWGQNQWSAATATVPRLPATVSAQGTIEVAFSPPGGATAAIVQAVGEAKQRIWVQAYSFTSAPIAKAVLSAAKRGVEVKVVLDKSQRTQKYSVADFFANQGVPVYVDDQHAIAHNKVMVIDSGTLITGSFNFSKAAEQANAENLLIFRGNPALQQLYADNFRFHLSHSTPYRARHGLD